MRALVIACGNPLRGDDGVGARTLELIRDLRGVERRSVQQLTPELAADLETHDVVIFVDADPSVTEVRIERLRPGRHVSLPTLTHAPSADEIVALARGLFAWRGSALTCSLPVSDFGEGETLSTRAVAAARAGAEALRRLLSQRAQASAEGLNEPS